MARIALVVVDDVSGSINDEAYETQKRGYFAAFTEARVIAAIEGGANGQIAVAYVEFASGFQVRTVLDWVVVRDAAMRLLGKVPVAADRKVIGVCGDGTNNLGREVTEARDEAAGKGIVINGLALANENIPPWLLAHTHPPGGLGNYYRANVATGPGSFVIEISSYDDFAEAIRRKLIQEIS